MNIKLSKVSFFLFVFFYNYIWTRMILFPYLYSQYGNMSFWYCGFILVICCLFFLIIPNKLYKYDYNQAYSRSKAKYIYSFILILEAIFGLLLGYEVLYRFVNDLNKVSLILALGIVIGVISNMRCSNLINLSTLFNITGILLIVFGFVYYIPIEFNGLFPIEYKSITPVLLMSLFIICDNISFLFIEKDNFNLSKMKLIIPIITAVLLLAFELFMLLGTAGDLFFKGDDFVGFMVMTIKPVAKYVGNFEFVYIICIILSIVYKFGFNMGIIKNNIISNNKHVKNIPIYIILIGTILASFFLNKDMYGYIVYGLNISKLLMLIWFVKEAYNVFKTKRK